MLAVANFLRIQSKSSDSKYYVDLNLGSRHLGESSSSQGIGSSASSISDEHEQETNSKALELFFWCGAVLCIYMVLLMIISRVYELRYFCVSLVPDVDFFQILCLVYGSTFNI